MCYCIRIAKSLYAKNCIRLYRNYTKTFFIIFIKIIFTGLLILFFSMTLHNLSIESATSLLGFPNIPLKLRLCPSVDTITSHPSVCFSNSSSLISKTVDVIICKFLLFTISFENFLSLRTKALTTCPFWRS